MRIYKINSGIFFFSFCDFIQIYQISDIAQYKLFTTTYHRNSNIVNEFKTLKVLLNQN